MDIWLSYDVFVRLGQSGEMDQCKTNIIAKSWMLFVSVQSTLSELCIHIRLRP